ncbi:MAG: ATP-binding cassette domain-containing protein [Lactobacillus crispatus]|nr:ATP-binding cassette domain-containing protein [Lactobacillus crispatus]
MNNTRNQVAQYLHNKKQGLIVISHDRNFVDKVVDHTLAIEMQKIRLEQGNYTRYEKQKELEDESNIAYNAKLEKQIKNLHASQQKMQTFAQRSESNKNAGAKMKGDIRHRSTVYDKGFMGHKAAKKMKLAKNVEARLDKNIEADNDLAMNFVPDHHKHLITAKGVSLAYDKLPLFQPTTFDLMRGHQIVITGKNGIGKSSLFKAITNTFAGTITGKLHSADKISISYLSQIEQSNNLSLKDFAQKHHLNYADFLNILHKLGTERDIFTNSINQMSSGQQKKIYLAKSLLEPANLYLWDEPLNYLDVFNQEQIIQLIKKYHPTMLVIEHDQRFIDELGAQVIHLT